jgi:hypothetical protein
METFKLPISYDLEVKELSSNIPLELELYETNTEEQCIYNDIFQPKLTNSYSKKVLEDFAKYYTTNVKFLKNTQSLIKKINIKKINTIYNKNNYNIENIENVVSLWNDIKTDKGFCEKYLYIDWDFAKNLNNHASFLQIMSLYNISSPLLSLCLPIFILIIPFFIIKIKGIELNMTEYVDILKNILSQQAIVRIFTNFNKVDFNQKIYLIMSAAFYVFSIYQNILVCIRFYSNMKKIHDYLFTFRDYLNHTIAMMKYHLHNSQKLTTYQLFNNELTKHLHYLENIYNDLTRISDFKISVSKTYEIGHIMQVFYQIYDNNLLNDSILYSFGFNSYYDLLYGLKMNINNCFLNKACYSGAKSFIKKMYYPKFMNNKCGIVNDCDLAENMIISGPNASGKTTYIKTAFINILLCQQVGYGCFKKCNLTPFHYFHCYLNIPDTSGRDSLFQAEARRCKYIIDSITNKKECKHFCIFDELYSGTNPEEAMISAYAFIQYINSHNNVNYLLTTHYLELCKKFDNSSSSYNYYMETNNDISNNDFSYTYNLKKGISNIKGGIKVLKDMDYPIEITNNLL